MKFACTIPIDRSFLPQPSVRAAPGEDQLCIFVHRAAEQLVLGGSEREYVEVGYSAYRPALTLQAWLYAYVLGAPVRVVWNNAFRKTWRFVSRPAAPDNRTLNGFRRRHGIALNDAFTQVFVLARSLGLARLGKVTVEFAPAATAYCLARLRRLKPTPR